MNDHYTHISIVMDRSGSMAEVRNEAQAAINNFLTDQKAQDGRCSLTFVDFDGQDPKHVVYNGDIHSAPTYVLNPRGMTPLLDAVGFTILHTGSLLEALPEAERPGKVIFVIQTDGQENVSREFSWEQVHDLIKEHTDTYSWQFIFLGMGLDTFKQGEALGVKNVISTDANNAVTYDSTHSVLTASTRSYRSGQTADMSAMSGMHVNSVGKVYSKTGEEIDPATGEPIKA